MADEGTRPPTFWTTIHDVIQKLKWFHATRAMGAALMLYGAFGDKSPDRATLILTGAGMIGWEFVKRSDPPASK